MPRTMGGTLGTRLTPRPGGDEKAAVHVRQINGGHSIDAAYRRAHRVRVTSLVHQIVRWQVLTVEGALRDDVVVCTALVVVVSRTQQSRGRTSGADAPTQGDRACSRTPRQRESGCCWNAAGGMLGSPAAACRHVNTLAQKPDLALDTTTACNIDQVPRAHALVLHSALLYECDITRRAVRPSMGAVWSCTLRVHNPQPSAWVALMLGSCIINTEKRITEKEIESLSTPYARIHLTSKGGSPSHSPPPCQSIRCPREQSINSGDYYVNGPPQPRNLSREQVQSLYAGRECYRMNLIDQPQ